MVCCVVLPTSLSAQAIVADHLSVGQFAQIPTSVVEQIRSGYRFYYVHTSHGSQLVTGMNMLAAEDAAYAKPYLYEVEDDIGALGDTSWAYPLRFHLNTHPDINVAMLSWCGGVSDNTAEGINTYLYAMSDLEQDYPGVTFVYMTGHLDGTGDDGNLKLRNDQIRTYCAVNGKVLFDFADIESYDPEGVRYPDASDACEWCYDWCSSHVCPGCVACAHSHCFNCYQKGKAFWWMMARVAGWSPDQPGCCLGRVGDVNYNGADEPTVADISALVDHLFMSGAALRCTTEADVNQSGGSNPEPGPNGDVTVADISILIDYLFLTGPSLGLPNCL